MIIPTVTITADYVVFKHRGTSVPLEFVVSGIVEGPPDSMIESVVQLARQYSRATDGNSEIVNVNVYEVWVLNDYLY